jgi:hypothetical protein
MQCCSASTLGPRHLGMYVRLKGVQQFQREALLRLQAARIHTRQARDLAQPQDHALARHVANVAASVEREQVCLRRGGKLNVADDHHAAAAAAHQRLVEQRAAENAVDAHSERLAYEAQYGTRKAGWQAARARAVPLHILMVASRRIQPSLGNPLRAPARLSHCGPGRAGALHGRLEHTLGVSRSPSRVGSSPRPRMSVRTASCSRSVLPSSPTSDTLSSAETSELEDRQDPAPIADARCVPVRGLGEREASHLRLIASCGA